MIHNKQNKKIRPLRCRNLTDLFNLTTPSLVIGNRLSIAGQWGKCEDQYHLDSQLIKTSFMICFADRNYFQLELHSISPWSIIGGKFRKKWLYHKVALYPPHCTTPTKQNLKAMCYQKHCELNFTQNLSRYTQTCSRYTQSCSRSLKLAQTLSRDVSCKMICSNTSQKH